MISIPKKQFNRALRMRDASNILGLMKQESNINSDIGVRVFDVLLSLGEKGEKGIRAVLCNPNWDPNYRSADAWHPEERAMIHHREDLALQIIQHRNFDKAEYPRVIRSANLLKANKVLSFLSQHTRA